MVQPCSAEGEAVLVYGGMTGLQPSPVKEEQDWAKGMQGRGEAGPTGEDAPTAGATVGLVMCAEQMPLVSRADASSGLHKTDTGKQHEKACKALC